MTRTKRQIKVARDALNFRESPAYGSVILMGPGLQLFRAELREFTLEADKDKATTSGQDDHIAEDNTKQGESTGQDGDHEVSTGG